MSQEAVEVHIRARAVAVEIAPIRHAVGAAAEACGMSALVRTDVALAVTEACSNVVAYAYVDAPAPGPLFVESYCCGRATSPCSGSCTCSPAWA